MFKKSLQRKYQYQKCSKGGPFVKFSTNTNILKLLPIHYSHTIYPI